MFILNNVTGSAVLLVISIIVVIILCYKGIHTGIAAITASIIMGFGTQDGVSVSPDKN